MPNSVCIPEIWRERAERARRIPSLFPFDATYGYGLDELLAVEPVTPPDDFEGFWQATYAQTRAVDPRCELREIASDDPQWRCYELDFDSFEGFRVGAWLLVPAEGVVTSVVVRGHGYGSVLQPVTGLFEGTATIQVCGRGFGRSAQPDLPGMTMEHVLHGIESRETYLHRGCVADLWAAVTAGEALYPGLPLFYYGGSFGGGLGTLALAWEKRFARAFIGYPSFGHHPLRLTFECTGSGCAVRERYLADPAILETLRYHDSSSAALWITTPTFIDVGCFDPAVPPPGQFAVFNALRASDAPHRFTVHTCHHFEVSESPAEVRQTLEEVVAWFQSAIDGKQP